MYRSLHNRCVFHLEESSLWKATWPLLARPIRPERRELTSGGDSGLTSWTIDPPDWSVTDSRTSLGDLSVLLETGGVDATHEGKALAYSPAAAPADGAGGREMEEEMRREEKHLRESR